MKEKLEERIEIVNGKIDNLKEYLLDCVDDCDFHGVADAAMDIREHIREMEVLATMIAEMEIGDGNVKDAPKTVQ